MLRQAWGWLRRLSGCRWARAAASVGGVVFIGYVALKLAPDLFGSDQLPNRNCDKPGEDTFKDCLDAVKARADDRRGITTATLALLAGALSAFGAYVTARTFSANRAEAQQSHEGVIYDDATTWPEGFDFRAAGAIHVDETDAEPDAVPPPD